MKNKTLWALLLIAALLRGYGSGFGLIHADEPIVVNHALAYGTGDLNPHFFAIPPLTSYLVFIVYGIFYAMGLAAQTFQGLEGFQSFFVRHPETFYHLARIFLGVIPGTLTVGLLFVSARRYFGPQTAFWSALFLTFNYLHARDSHYVYADIPMVFCATAAAFASVRVYEEGRKRDYLLAGLWVGLAAAFKYNAVLVVIAVLTAHLLRKPRTLRPLLLSAGFSAVVYLASNPFSLLDLPFFIESMRTQAKAEGVVGAWHLLNYSLAGSASWVFLALAFAGIAHMFRENAKKAAVIFSFPALFFLKLIVFSQHHERYVLPLLPFLCLAAGWACAHLPGRRPWLKLGVGALAVFSLFFSASKIVYADMLFKRPDTRELARRWIEEYIPASSKIAFDHSFYRPALLRADAQWDALSGAAGAKKLRDEAFRRFSDPTRPRYELFFLGSDNAQNFSMARPMLGYEAQALRGENVRYLVRHYGVHAEHPEFYSEILKGAKLLKRVSPYDEEGKSYSADRYSTTCAAFESKELFSRERFGPVLEIYELRAS